MPSHPPVRSVQVMSTATRDHPSGSLRVSDADRDRAIAESLTAINRAGAQIILTYWAAEIAATLSAGQEL